MKILIDTQIFNCGEELTHEVWFKNHRSSLIAISYAQKPLLTSDEDYSARWFKELVLPGQELKLVSVTSFAIGRFSYNWISGRWRAV